MAPRAAGLFEHRGWSMIQGIHCGMGAEERTDWMVTRSGIKVYLTEPTPSVVNIHDIAFALSNVCRFGGHCNQFYSVAQHSVHVAETVSDRTQDNELAFAALLHDATEAYLGDMVRPLKQHMPQYRDLEARWAVAIGERFGVCLEPLHPEIKRADIDAVRTERDRLVTPHDGRWFCDGPDSQSLSWVAPLAPGDACAHFLRFYEATIRLLTQGEEECSANT